ncbi:hypothetical protein G7Z17_g80 [Cylindrodendrum hubeiense]|uniref:Heterokaryon incompatibility domain-containing protein n=1 Tax=Cylindrodendrum hubeiense TaxID=595255 RepID=A0A9P5HHD2_9HYPO|nr:hypothetical protein G7Z17_g80 [Cylindrodendrum hubeiense]
MVSHSRLLLGSRSGLAVRTERHKHLTPGELELSATKCQLCSFLLASLKEQEQPEQPNSEELEDGHYFVFDVKKRDSTSPLSVRIHASRTMKSTTLHLFTDTHECDISETTESDTVFDLAKYWIEECQQHPILGEPGSPIVHLIETKGMDSCKYTALSHCWGGKVPEITLRQNTLDALKQSISIAELPKNFQDAITVTRGIGIRYVWIDSLCILQDSVQDWRDESIAMGLVYAHAREPSKCFLRGGDGDILGTRPADYEKRQEVALDELFDRYVEKAPLSKRGWTFQERVLAQRVLHFCDGLVLFECNTLRASELYADGVRHPEKQNFRIDGTFRKPNEKADSLEPRPVEISGGHKMQLAPVFVGSGWAYLPSYLPTWKENPNYKTPEELQDNYYRNSALRGMRGEFQLLLRARGKLPGEMVEFHKSWYEIVERYAGRNLSKESDRLPAVLGVADFIKRSSRRLFVAGLWEDTIPMNLLWNVKETNAIARSSIPVPTWSWASISVSIETQLRHVKTENPKLSVLPLISIAGIENTVKHNGWIHNAELKLVGRLCDFSRLKTNDIMDRLNAGVDLVTARDVHYLPILELNRTIVDDVDDSQIHGIIVRRKFYIRDEFERIGYFSSTVQDVTLEMLKQPKREMVLV